MLSASSPVRRSFKPRTCNVFYDVTVMSEMSSDVREECLECRMTSQKYLLCHMTSQKYL